MLSPRVTRFTTEEDDHLQNYSNLSSKPARPQTANPYSSNLARSTDLKETLSKFTARDSESSKQYKHLQNNSNLPSKPDWSQTAKPYSSSLTRSTDLKETPNKLSARDSESFKHLTESPYTKHTFTSKLRYELNRKDKKSVQDSKTLSVRASYSSSKYSKENDLKLLLRCVMKHVNHCSKLKQEIEDMGFSEILSDYIDS